MIHLIPYVVILGANALYIYSYNYDPEEDKVQIFLFNFVIMLFIGIFAIIKVNMMLHQWIIVEKEKDEKGNLNTKGIMKQKIKEVVNLSYMVENLFLPGNEKFLLKVKPTIYRFILCLQVWDGLPHSYLESLQDWSLAPIFNTKGWFIRNFSPSLTAYSINLTMGSTISYH